MNLEQLHELFPNMCDTEQHVWTTVTEVNRVLMHPGNDLVLKVCVKCKFSKLVLIVSNPEF